MLCLPSDTNLNEKSPTIKRIILIPFKKHVYNDKYIHKHIKPYRVLQAKINITWLVAELQWFSNHRTHTAMLLLFYKSHILIHACQKNRAHITLCVWFPLYTRRFLVERGMKLWRKRNVVCVCVRVHKSA